MSSDHPLELSLVVAGESQERVLELVRNMEDSRHFRQAAIVSQVNAMTPVAGDNVQFNISSLYVPETTSIRSLR